MKSNILFVVGIFGLLTCGQSHADASNAADFTTFKVGDSSTIKFNTLIQGWSIQNENSSPNGQSIRLRRSEFKVSGVIENAPKYFFMVDPAKLIVPPNGSSISADNMIQDFGLTYAIVPGLELTAGQFKIPNSAEGLDSATDLPLPERSVVGRAYGDKREMGVKLGYRTPTWNVVSMVSSGRYLTAAGEGMFNDLDTRFEFTPTKELNIGTFLALGGGFDYETKGRWGVNGRYLLGNAHFRAEYAQGKDRAVQSHGVTTEAGYFIADNFEPVARYESFSANQAFTDAGHAETIGINYYIRSYFAKLQLAASALQNMAAINGTPVIANGADNKEVTLALQFAI